MKIIDFILSIFWQITYCYTCWRQARCRHVYPLIDIPDHMASGTTRCTKCRKQLVIKKGNYNFKGVLPTDYYRGAGYR